MLGLETFKEKYPNFKKISIVVGAFILLSISFGLGNNSASVELGKEKVKYDEAQAKVSAAKNDIKEYQAKLAQVKAEYDKNKSDLDYARQIYDQKTSLEGQLSTLNGQIDTKKKESDSLDATIQSKNAQIASLDQTIKTKQEAPTQLPAGQFVGGKDVKVGRYKVEPVGEGSNFIVHDVNGYGKVNTILGSDGVASYVFELDDGDQIRSEAPVKLTPIE
jgi:hypothetical protein